MSQTLTRGLRVALLTALLTLALGASQATAATSYVGSSSFGSGPGAGDGVFTHPKRVAVDHDNGHVYVVDADNDRVQVFAVDADSASYLTELAGFDDPYGVAIDQDASPIAVYVSDAGNGRIVRLESDGAATPAFTVDAGFVSPAAGAGSTRVGDFHADVEVDPATGDLLVADPADDLVQRYDDSGTFVDAFNGADSPSGGFTGLQDIAADSSGVYVVDAQGGAPADGGSSRVERFDGAGVHQANVRSLQGEGDGLVAIDPDNGNVLVGDVRGFSANVRVLDASGSLLSSISVPNTVQLTGLAVDGATTGRLYAAGDDPFCDGGCGQIGVQVLEATELPDATVQPIATFDEFTATLEATVDPNGNAGTGAYIEYSTDQSNWTQGTFHDESTDPGLDGGTDPVAISDTVKGLTPGTTYYVRVSVSSPAGAVTSAVEQFTTAAVPAPEVTIDPITDVGGREAQLSGTVDPNGFETEYRFEVAIDDGSPDWEPFGEGSSDEADPISVAAGATGLRAQTSYLARVVASNVGGGATSSEVAFATTAAPPTVKTLPASGRSTTAVRLNGTVNPNGEPTTYYVEYGPTTAYGTSIPLAEDGDAGSGHEPVRYSKEVTNLVPGSTLHYRIVATNATGTSEGDDRTATTLTADRAYELVSEPDKGGGNVAPFEGAQAAPDGNAAMYSSTSAFADPEAATAYNTYVSRRTADGWHNLAQTPPQLNSKDLFGRPVLAFSDDLRTAFGMSALALAPGASEPAGNLYLQDTDTRERTYVGGSPDPALLGHLGNASGGSLYGDASDDFGSVVFESAMPLVPGASEGWSIKHVYEVADGAVRIVDVLEDGTIASTADYAGMRGPGKNGVSADGRRIFFLAPNELGVHTLYARQDGETTIPISESQRAGTDPSASVGPRWGGASRDGATVFFDAGAPLTDDAAPGTAITRLYRYEAGDLEEIAAGSEVLGGGDSPIVHVSDDGSVVYFVTPTALDDTSARTPHLYVWREGEGTTLVAAAELLITDQGGGIGTPFPSGPNQISVSASGRYMVFHTYSRLTEEDNRNPACVASQSFGSVSGHCSSVYRYDSVAHELDCVSCNPTGEGPTAHSVIAGTSFSSFLDRYGAYSRHYPVVAFDDGTVYFDSHDRLVPEDTDGQRDGYQWRDGELALMTPGTATPTATSDISADQRDVFFVTQDRLVGLDRDDSRDLYDARIGGGLPSQGGPPGSPGCSEDGCQGDPGGGPAPRTLGSSDESAASDDRAERARLALGRPSSAQLSRLARGRPIRLRVRTTGPGRIRVAVTARVDRRTRTLATASRTVARAGTHTVQIRLTPAATRLVARRSALRISLRARGAGATPSRGLNMVLRRPAARRADADTRPSTRG